ncbi:exodeoxyribonuclease VII large subunit [Candidatus Mycosynbacter amalyticus]|uniref:Exodeoxyribonuclease 7 large subunit n=1 Tax=Candidatus Mycosynbacter amalyticus TaxID=2665156 RepID=A0A857MK95_9BACT|nr:exodeoxyribonuclease VII large subunit [Candidatus Mycosynbacter amalyticus]QHN42558.1 exodeoxyribonuclease VII large subunit [Candidatus Mycosynbacter amalyticus]
MENSQLPAFSVSDFVASTNQTLEYAYPTVVVEGEVESFKVNQGKFVFFNLKDAGASIGCFMMVFALRVPLEDGMKVAVRARPKLTNFGKFSLTVDAIKPVGEGSIKKGFELLKAKLDAEGLFAPERKRLLPTIPRTVGIISSMQSAGYGDFMKIANERWGGVEFKVYHTLVQGLDAPEAMVRAIEYFNQLETPLDALVIIRGGGSTDDLSAFNDEQLVRSIAASRTPTLVGVGHEVDVTLSDLAADVRAATPSNAAQLLLPDKREVSTRVKSLASRLAPRMVQLILQRAEYVQGLRLEMYRKISSQLEQVEVRVGQHARLLESYNPAHVLARGYALVRGDAKPGGMIEVESSTYTLTAEVKSYDKK